MYPNSKDLDMNLQESQQLSDRFIYHEETEESTTPNEEQKSCRQASKFIPRSMVSKADESVEIVL